MSQSSLLKCQIGPVQEFIAQARSTRDLWSGSYLLSFLMAAGIRRLRQEGGQMIFPNPEGQPLLDDPDGWKSQSSDEQKRLLTPNLPNVFVAEIAGNDPAQVAKKVKEAIEEEWKAIARACFDKLEKTGVLQAQHENDFLAQARAMLSIAWQVTPLDGDYHEVFDRNGRALDAVRQTRDFAANPLGKHGEKDSLNGKDFAFVRGGDAHKKCKDSEYTHFFKHADDYLSAITLIKRVWHLAYLKDARGLKTGSKQYVIRSIPAIATRANKEDDEESPQEKTSEDSYIAAIAFDGDSIGDWISGKKLGDPSALRDHHSIFSAALSDFAMQRACAIVEEQGGGTSIPLGFMIYAGGDDVLALVPADAALLVAGKLRDAFCHATAAVKDQNSNTPDASAGIAIAHIHSPLQDLIQAAQAAEKRAKNIIGKPAFSVTLMKRSGEISQWGAKWDDGGIALHDQIFQLLGTEALSAKFPHRVCQLLTPYLTQRRGLNKEASDVDVLDAGTACELVRREFAFAVQRQSGGNHNQSNQETLFSLLETYLEHLQKRHQNPEENANPLSVTLPQYLFQSLIELCTAVAFAHRSGHAPNNQPIAEKQTT